MPNEFTSSNLRNSKINKNLLNSAGTLLLLSLTSVLLHLVTLWQPSASVRKCVFGVSSFLQLFTLHLSGAFLLPIDMSRPSTRRRAVEALFLQFISRAKAAFFSLLTYENAVEIPAERFGYQRRFLHLCDFTYF